MRYYILQGGEQRGPYTLAQMQAMWRAGEIHGKMQYAPEGMRPIDLTKWPLLFELESTLEPQSPRSSPAPQAPRTIKAAPSTSPKVRVIYQILAVVLGALGIHNFYAGYHEKGAIQLCATVLLGWMVLPLLIVWVWALVEVFTVTTEANGVPMT